MKTLLCLLALTGAVVAGDLDRNSQSPPREAQPWVYWWWLNGAASKEGITRDFEEMKKQGICGALLFDAGDGGPNAPKGPPFMSMEWRGLFKHAVREAERLGIAMSVNVCTGWNAGGPWITHEHGIKVLASAHTTVEGGGAHRHAPAGTHVEIGLLP